MAVSDDAFDRTWRQLAEEVLSSMGEWRREHPEASLSEIEGALDTRLLRLRAQVLANMQDAQRYHALQTETAELKRLIGAAEKSEVQTTPAEIFSVPDSASARLPSTGASSRPTRSPSADASRRTASGPTVDISITVVPSPTPAAIPASPSVTSRSAAGLATIVSTASARAAASAGVAAPTAPASTSGAPLSAVRFHTTTS